MAWRSYECQYFTNVPIPLRRVGDYRVLYTVDDEGKKIEVISVADRKEVYR